MHKLNLLYDNQRHLYMTKQIHCYKIGLRFVFQIKQTFEYRKAIADCQIDRR